MTRSRESHKEDDSHRRWKQSEHKQIIWRRYDEEIVPEIVSKALQDPNITLKSLYHLLSIARRSAELEKDQSKDQARELTYDEYFISSHAKEFSVIPFGCYHNDSIIEPDIYKGFGETVGRFMRQRIRPKSFGYRGLSLINGDLYHPKGSIFEKLEPQFQELIHTQNFFEYLNLASRLMFDLSNYPQVMRGTAAINTWLIDKIAQEKFGIRGSLRPLLYDWMAFVDTPENYSNFYIISATVKYIESIPELYEQDRDFYDSIPDIMAKNPIAIEVIEERQHVWREIQSKISNYLDHADLQVKESQNLEAIKLGVITFRKPSLEVINFVRELSESLESDPTLTHEKLDTILTRVSLFKEDLKSLLEFDKDLHNAGLYLFDYEKNTEKYDKLWLDLAVLQELSDPKYYQVLSNFLGIDAKSERYKERPVLSGFGWIRVSEIPDNFKEYLQGRPSFVMHNGNTYYVSANTDWLPVKSILTYHIGNIDQDTWTELSIPSYETAVSQHHILGRRKLFSLLASISFAEPSEFARVPKRILDLIQDDTQPLSLSIKCAICTGDLKIQDLVDLSPEEISMIFDENTRRTGNRNPIIRITHILQHKEYIHFLYEIDTILKKNLVTFTLKQFDLLQGFYEKLLDNLFENAHEIQIVHDNLLLEVEKLKKQGIENEDILGDEIGLILNNVIQFIHIFRAQNYKSLECNSVSTFDYRSFLNKYRKQLVEQGNQDEPDEGESDKLRK